MARERLAQSSDWFTAGQALEFGKTIAGDAATKIIMEHLKGKKLTAYAQSWSKEAFGAYEVESYDQEVEIPAHIWNHLTDDFWTTGIAIFFRPSGNAAERSVTYRYYGVRFNPSDITKLFPGPTPKPLTENNAILAKYGYALTGDGKIPPPPPSLVPPKPAAEETDKPDLAVAALARWYEAYKVAYEPHERNLDHAWEHAKMAFPEKGIARKRIRDLMTGGKPGPKPKKS